MGRRSSPWDQYTRTESGLYLSDNTIANASTTAHGLLPKLSGSSSDVLRGDGTWSSVGAGVITGIDGAEVSTQETTASTSYTNLATTGPSVTITTGTSVWISWGAFIFRSASGSGNSGFMSFEISGATTLAASDTNAIFTTGTSQNFAFTSHRRIKLTGLTAGSNTFTGKYRVDGSTFAFQYRHIVIEVP